MKKVLTVALTLVVCAVLFFTREKTPEFRTVQVQVRDLVEKIEAVGSVVPERTCALMPSVAGKISRVFVKEGQSVGQGQAVAEVELLPQDAAAYLSALQNTELDAETMREQLHKMCTVYAPQEGTVTGFTAYAGAQTAPGAALGYVISPQPVVCAMVPESLREDLFEGQSASILRGDAQIKGEIECITPASEASGQYLVRIRMLESAGSLKPGMKADVEILVDACTAPCVPLQALQPDGTVLCRTEGGAAAVPVQTGLCTETYAQLLSGPPVGTRVILGEVE